MPRGKSRIVTQNLKTQQMKTRLMHIHFRVEDLVYMNKPISVSEARGYHAELLSIKQQFNLDTPSHQVYEKLERIMRELIEESGDIVASSSNIDINNSSEQLTTLPCATSTPTMDMILNESTTTLPEDIPEPVIPQSTKDNASFTNEEEINYCTTKKDDNIICTKDLSPINKESASENIQVNDMFESQTQIVMTSTKIIDISSNGVEKCSQSQSLLNEYNDHKNATTPTSAMVKPHEENTTATLTAPNVTNENKNNGCTKKVTVKPSNRRLKKKQDKPDKNENINPPKKHKKDIPKENIIKKPKTSKPKKVTVDSKLEDKENLPISNDTNNMKMDKKTKPKFKTPLKAKTNATLENTKPEETKEVNNVETNIGKDLSWVKNIELVREVDDSECYKPNAFVESFWDNCDYPADWDDKDFKM